MHAINKDLRQASYSPLLVETMRNLTLRELGLYALPDGRKFIAHANGQDGYSLFSLGAWGIGSKAEYLVRRDDSILSKGVPT